jgi:hypothetical protein
VLSMKEHNAQTSRAMPCRDHRAASSNAERSRQSISLAVGSRADAARTGRELDSAFLRWLEARVATGDPEASEEDAINYLVALALNGGGSW